MNRIRTIPQVMDEIHKLDPSSAITEHHIRQLAKAGEFQCFFAGTRLMLNLDDVLSYFSPEKPEKKES